MSAASEAPAAVEAMADARRTGEGFVRVQRITTEQYRVERVDPTRVVLLDEARPADEALADLVLMLPCSYCLAESGEHCTTSSGQRASCPHVARMGPVHEAYHLGFVNGVPAGMRRALAAGAGR